MATVCLLAMMVFAPVALAQETTMVEEETTVVMEETQMMEDTAMEETTAPDEDLPESGGPAILLPAAALLLGSGILTYAVLRRR